MASDQSIEEQTNQDPAVDLEALENRVKEARLQLKQNSQNPEAEQQFEATIESLYREQFQKFSAEDRQSLQQHPAFSFIQENIQSLDVDDKANAVLFLGYVNSLPISEASNPVFPGYNSENQRFTGLSDFRTTRKIVTKLFESAAEQACNNCVDKEGNALINPMALEQPDGVTASNITLDQVKRDLGMFKDEEGVRTIAEMRRQFAEDGTFNPYRLSLMGLSSRATFEQIKSITELKFFNRNNFLKSEFEGTFNGIALVDQNISIEELAEKNGLNESQVERLTAMIDGTLALGTVTTEASDLMDNDGFMQWAMETAKKHGDDFKGEGAFAKIAEQPERVAEILETAPGMNESRALHTARNLGTVLELFDRIEAAEQGLTLDDYRLYEEGGTVAFLQRHVAQERGEDVPRLSDEERAKSLDSEINNLPDLSSGAYKLRWPLIDGLNPDGERFSTSLFTDEEGDGLRLGALNVNGFNDAPSPELFFRHSLQDVGKFELGYLAHNDGDYDGEIRTLRPYVGDHFENYGGIIGLRFAGEDLSLGSGLLTPDATIGEYKGDLFLQSGLKYDLDLSKNVNFLSGASFTLAQQEPRADVFGTLGVDLTGDPNAATQTLWRSGFQGTRWMGDESRFLGTGFTELEINTSGDQWYSNLRNVFGAFANTDDNYGVYSEHTKRLDLGIFGTPDVGLRLQYDREDEFQPGFTMGWRF